MPSTMRGGAFSHTRESTVNAAPEALWKGMRTAREREREERKRDLKGLGLRTCPAGPLLLAQAFAPVRGHRRDDVVVRVPPQRLLHRLVVQENAATD